MKFKIKEGHPKMAVIWEGKKYWLSLLDELPDGLYKAVGGAKNIYGIVKIKPEKQVKEIKNGSSNSK